ncbi:hypothetical protein OPV22_012438 [Ensete ventricosum]|uniref:Uncharacterized protein n=1 Tax=Ensete ventricosum TaxID=4639 RepID=A0AAV8QTB4_ENSVE|nr:hypothetical protein OPV22_012438 [Ensete ventricosum]
MCRFYTPIGKTEGTNRSSQYPSTSHAAKEMTSIAGVREADKEANSVPLHATLMPHGSEAIRRNENASHYYRGERYVKDKPSLQRRTEGKPWH